MTTERAWNLIAVGIILVGLALSALGTRGMTLDQILHGGCR